MRKTTLHLGLGVHEESITITIAIAIASGGRDGEVRHYGAISNDLHALEKAIIKIRRAHRGAKIEACYE